MLMNTYTDDLTEVANAVHSTDPVKTRAAAAASTDMKTAMGALSESVLMLPFTEARARALEEFDCAFLTAALARNSGNIARTARSLGLHRQSLQKLMARRGIKSGRL